MKKLFTLIVLICATITLSISCKKKPTDNIKLNINADIIKYTAYISISDITDAKVIPANLRLSVSGDDAQYVYEISGTKDFKVNNGNITIGLAPQRTPAAGTPVVFTINISADGYMPVMKQVTMNAGQTTQRINVKMMNYVNPPAGTSIKLMQYNLANGALQENAISEVSRTTDTDYYSASAVAVVLPAGTTFTYDSVYTPVIGRKSYYLPSGNLPVALPEVISKTNVKRGIYHGTTVQMGILFGASSTEVLQSYDVSGGSDNSNIRMLNGSSAPYTHLFLTDARKAKLLSVFFIGINEYGQAVQLYPSDESNWYITCVLNNSIINPQTNATIKEGDLIETGVDFANDSTKTAVIQKDPLGNLRVKTRSVEVGYYAEAASVVNFSYQVNTAIDSNVIPDPENLYGTIVASIVTGSQGSSTFASFYDDVPVNAGIYTFARNIVSQTPYTLATPTYVVRYFDAEQIMYDIPAMQSSYFGADLEKQLLSPISFSFSLTCEQSNKVIYPSLYFQVETGNNADFICHVKNGQWKTRGLKPGTYNFSGYYSGIYVGGEPVTINAGHNDIALKTNDGICKLFE